MVRPHTVLEILPAHRFRFWGRVYVQNVNTVLGRWGRDLDVNINAESHWLSTPSCSKNSRTCSKDFISLGMKQRVASKNNEQRIKKDEFGRITIVRNGYCKIPHFQPAPAAVGLKRESSDPLPPRAEKSGAVFILVVKMMLVVTGTSFPKNNMQQLYVSYILHPWLAIVWTRICFGWLETTTRIL